MQMTKTLTLTDEQHGLLCDMFSAIADLGLFDAPVENAQATDPELFDHTWDVVINAK